jgi:hypothetical protein
MLLGESKCEARFERRLYPELRPPAPGELTQAKRCASALSWLFGPYDGR